MVIEIIKNEDIDQASNLVKRMFDEFVSEDYGKNGISYFYEMISPAAIMRRLKGNSLAFVSKDDNVVTGYIEISDFSHIYLLFVEKEYHNRGIARKLLNYAVGFIKEKNIVINEVTVNTTLSALPFYEILGFKKIADYQLKNGILSYPMKLVLK